MSIKYYGIIIDIFQKYIYVNFPFKLFKPGIKAKIDLIQKFPPKANIKCKFGNNNINIICFRSDLVEIHKNTDIYLDFDRSKILLSYARNGELVNNQKD